MQRTALSREEKDAAIKEKADTQLGALPAGSRLVYTDGGADGNGANGQHGACGFGVVVTEKQEDWTPPVPRAQSVLRSAPAYWLMSLRPMLVQIL